MTAEYKLGTLAIEEDSNGNFDFKDDNGDVIATYDIANDEWDYQSETVKNLLIDLDGNDLTDGAAVIWDTSNSQIPQGRLENDSITVTAGDGLTNGGSVALGGSIAPDVQVSDFAGTLLADDGSNNLVVQEGNISHDSIDQATVSSDDHHARYTDEEAQDAVGTITSGGTNVTATYDDGANTLTIDTSALNEEEVEDAVNGLLSGGDGITTTYDDANDSLSVDTAVADFAGTLLSADGNNNLQVDEANISHDALSGFVSNEHIDHSSITVTAGDGLTGGGDLTASRTINGHTVTTQTSNYTAGENDVVLADASSADFTVTLPSPSQAIMVTVKKTDASSNTVTIATPGTETIDGDSSRTLTAQNVSRTITSDGSNYFII